MGRTVRMSKNSQRDASSKLADHRLSVLNRTAMMKLPGAVITRASVSITILVTLLLGCDNPFGPSETDLQYGLNDVAMVASISLSATTRPHWDSTAG